MKVKVKIEKEFEAKRLHVFAGVRYWDDGTVNGIDDEDGKIPCRNGDNWEPVIDVDSGKITNWTQGVTASVHYKVCDDGSYFLKTDEGEDIASIKDDYVPKCMYPKENSYGDYIIMDIDENGFIKDWKFSMSGFKAQSEDD